MGKIYSYGSRYLCLISTAESREGEYWSGDSKLVNKNGSLLLLVLWLSESGAVRCGQPFSCSRRVLVINDSREANKPTHVSSFIAFCQKAYNELISFFLVTLRFILSNYSLTSSFRLILGVLLSFSVARSLLFSWHNFFRLHIF
jgi:hypothetical protein